jgi:hypothetical protein
MRKMNIKIRAFFLLGAFSLNTLAGFACSVGLDLYYNSNHHKNGLNTHDKSQTHESRHKHSHTSSHKHNKTSSHKHSHTTSDLHKEDERGKSQDDCCTDEVTKFAQLDKSVTNLFQLQIPVFIKLFPDLYSLTLQPMQSISVNSNFQFVRRSCSIYDTDIRIAIQSFQI